MTGTLVAAAAAQAAGEGRLLAWLEPQDLMNKWGFGDGDMADDWVGEWAAASWPSSVAGPRETQEALNSYLNSRALLGAAVQDLLLPTLRLPRHFTDKDSGIRVTFDLGRIGSVHNPWRLIPMSACRADGSGIEVDDIDESAWENTESQADAHLRRCHPVAVPEEWVRQRCEELYPPRGSGWLDLMSVMATYLPVSSLLPDYPKSRGDWYAGARSLADTLSEGYDDEIVGLAAEFVEGLAHSASSSPLSVDQVRQSLASAQLVAGTPARRALVPRRHGSDPARREQP